MPGADAPPHLELAGLAKSFGKTAAVVDFSLSVPRGSFTTLLGPSGCGKTTVLRMVGGFVEADAGSVRLGGVDQVGRPPNLRGVGMVFQDYALFPHMSVRANVEYGLRMHRFERGERERRVARALALLDLAGLAARYPHELSGGQRQRVALGRALVLGPKLVIADEPVSALDVSVQASILNLILDLQQDLGFSCLFITHDLSVVEFVSDRIAVMYLGRIVEKTSREKAFSDPQHPYTQSLLSAAPVPDPRLVARQRIVLAGDLPSPANPPSGCHFHTRCPVAIDRCARDVPDLADRRSAGHLVSCHLVTEDRKPELWPGPTTLA